MNFVLIYPIFPLNNGFKCAQRLAVQPRSGSPSHFRAQDRRRAGPVALDRIRISVTILAGK
jgi:hypothetical protein